MGRSALAVIEELHSEERGKDPEKKDWLGHIEGAVTNEIQAWGTVIKEGALRGVRASRCPPGDGKVTPGEGKDLFHYDPDFWCNYYQPRVK